jgi:hypothetical protein
LQTKELDNIVQNDLGIAIDAEYLSLFLSLRFSTSD